MIYSGVDGNVEPYSLTHLHKLTTECNQNKTNLTNTRPTAAFVTSMLPKPVFVSAKLCQQRQPEFYPVSLIRHLSMLRHPLFNGSDMSSVKRDFSEPHDQLRSNALPTLALSRWCIPTRCRKYKFSEIPAVYTEKKMSDTADLAFGRYKILLPQSQKCFPMKPSIMIKISKQKPSEKD